MGTPTTLRALLLGGPGHDGYAYRAEVYCVDCGRDVIRSLWEEKKLPATLEECPDTENCPQPIFFGSSDCPQHCTHCGEYLYGEQPTEDDDTDAEE